MTLFKSKLKADDQTIIGLLKYFNVPVPRGNGVILDQAELKKPDFLFTVNIRLMQKLNKVLNQENRNVKPEANSQFKYFIGSGNNHPSVRAVIKRRNWWYKDKHERWYGQNIQFEDDSEDSDCD